MGPRELFRALKGASLFGPEPDEAYRVPMRIRTPDGSNRPVTLVLGSDGLVRWEYTDTEDTG